ncbi:hypothetical protein DL96DRAFT_1615854 [Flagelloscypha sp. PMI_526]|nr:hypothetical protein DL96DRAFT_1615854 [Flagelloscypha sp. PMI_526]
MLVDNYLRLWSPTPPLEKKDIQPATVYSHIATLFVTGFIWGGWALILFFHAIRYQGQSSMTGSHFWIPMLILEGVEVVVLTWLWRQSLVERPKVKETAK